MAKRKRLRGERINHERWLVSYADFITLLFAFFVVMYAISTINVGKYKVLSATLATAFEDPKANREAAQAKRDPDPIQIGEIKRGGSVIEMLKEQTDSDKPLDAEPIIDVTDPQAQLDGLFRQIQTALTSYINDQVVSVVRESEWIEVDMKSSLLFASGSADLGLSALPILAQIAEILRVSPNEIHVEGHTDNVPINTVQFPSNWELSAARAASVVHEFMRDGVDPHRMAAIGYSEYQPVVDNKTEEGRNANRRVVLVLLPKGKTRHKKTGEEAVKQFETGLGGSRNAQP